MLPKALLLKIQALLRSIEPQMVDATVAAMVVYSKEMDVKREPGISYLEKAPAIESELSQINEYFILQDFRETKNLCQSTWIHRIQSAQMPFAHLACSPLQACLKDCKIDSEKLPRAFYADLEHVVTQLRAFNSSNIENVDSQ